MDTQTISTAAATGVLAIKIGSTYLQSRFPDSRRIRLIHVPAMALGALSYAVMGHDKATALYGAAGIRSAVRSTETGAKRSKLLGTFMSVAIGAYTAATYKEPADLIPFTSFVVGTLGDMSSQGRYMRLMFLSAIATCAMPYAIIKDNFMMATAEGLSTVFMAKAICQHDLAGASRTKSKLRDLKAYLHGIFTNSATGAKMEGQYSKTTTNPYVETVPEPAAS